MKAYKRVKELEPYLRKGSLTTFEFGGAYYLGLHNMLHSKKLFRHFYWSSGIKINYMIQLVWPPRSSKFYHQIRTQICVGQLYRKFSYCVSVLCALPPEFTYFMYFTNGLKSDHIKLAVILTDFKWLVK